MRVHNAHERVYNSDANSVGALIDSLATSEDRLWPTERWPPMRLDQPLTVGAKGGHGPIRYAVEQYISGRRVFFRFLAPRGFKGAHGFEVEPRGNRTVLRHVLQMETSGLALLSWHLVFRPLHDALIEDAFDKAAASIGRPAARPAGWSPYVRVLRAVFKAVRDSKHVNIMKLRHTTPHDLPFLLEMEKRFARLGFVHSDDIFTHQQQMRDPDYAYYTVQERENPAGYVILRGLTSADRSLELKRIVIAEPGHGVGTQVLRAVIDKAFCEFLAHRLWLDVFEDNHRARHVYRSLGFVEETTPRKFFQNGDRQRLLIVMSMLESKHGHDLPCWRNGLR